MPGVLIDLDGVIWEGDNAVPGAADAIGDIAAANIPYLFVTNTTSRPRRLIVDKLAALGITVPADKILTPVAAAVQWLRSHDEGATSETAALIVPAATREDFADIHSYRLTADAHDPDDGITAVVIGDISTDWNFNIMNRAFRLLMRTPAPQLLALGMTRYWRNRDGLQLDVAPFIKALEHAADCTAVVVGKPGAEFFSLAAGQLDCAVEELVMVGDDILGDVEGAQRAGLQGILVRTGKFSERDLQRGVTPDAVLDSIAGLPAQLGI